MTRNVDQIANRIRRPLTGATPADIVAALCELGINRIDLARAAVHAVEARELATVRTVAEHGWPSTEDNSDRPTPPSDGERPVKLTSVEAAATHVPRAVTTARADYARIRRWVDDVDELLARLANYSPDRATQAVCRHCSALVPRDATHCPVCHLAADETRCVNPACGTVIARGDARRGRCDACRKWAARHDGNDPGPEEIERRAQRSAVARDRLTPCTRCERDRPHRDLRDGACFPTCPTDNAADRRRKRIETGQGPWHTTRDYALDTTRMEQADR